MTVPSARFGEPGRSGYGHHPVRRRALSGFQSVTRVLSELAIWAMTAIRDAVAGVTYDD